MGEEGIGGVIKGKGVCLRAVGSREAEKVGDHVQFTFEVL